MDDNVLSITAQILLIYNEFIFSVQLIVFLVFLTESLESQLASVVLVDVIHASDDAFRNVNNGTGA